MSRVEELWEVQEKMPMWVRGRRAQSEMMLLGRSGIWQHGSVSVFSFHCEIQRRDDCWITHKLFKISSKETVLLFEKSRRE